MNVSGPNISSSLVLGTAQLGSCYGIANKTGQPSQDMATAIVKEAWENGIHEFDTAQVYGESEYVLGTALSDLKLSERAKITTKFNPDLDHLDYNTMSNALNGSLKRLGVPDLFCIMLHGEKLLSLCESGLMEVLKDFVAGRRVKNVGVSVYSPEKAIQALNTEGIDIVQLPTNILDRRFEKAGVFQLADHKKKIIYVRSVFLQGLILLASEKLPDKMAFAMPVLNKLESLSVNLNLKKQELALGYIKTELPGTKVVFGADSVEQVKENCLCWKRELPPSAVLEVKSFFDNVDEKILNPSLWHN